jgi:hypothetical protein
MARGKKTGGRIAGTPNKNKSTAELKELAREYGPDSIAFFAVVRDDPAQPIMARLWAGRELVYLGYGRPAQAITGADGRPLKTATTLVIELHES